MLVKCWQIVGVVGGLLGACAQAPTVPVVDAGQDPMGLSEAQREACAALAQVACTHKDQCDPSRDPSATSPDERCLAIEAASCEGIYALPGARSGPEGALARAQTLSEHDCSYLSWAIGDWRGTLEEGRSCVHDEQCASGACAVAGTCGKCTASSADQEKGEPCGEFEEGRKSCRGKLVCTRPVSSLIGTCQELPSAGSPCDASQAAAAAHRI